MTLSLPRMRAPRLRWSRPAWTQAGFCRAASDGHRSAFAARLAKAEASTLRALFVGTISVRKGIPELLQAWERSNVVGELVLVGSVEPALAPLVRRAVERGVARHVEYTSDVAGYYRASDMFIFPTLEEGGPQVTLEAGGCGLPVITTSMGATRLVKHEVNGIIVPEGDVTSLTDAIVRLANSEADRRRFSKKIQQDALQFSYDKVGADRARKIAEIMAKRLPARPSSGRGPCRTACRR